MIASHRRAASVAAAPILSAQVQNQIGTVTSRYLAAFDLLGRAHVIAAATKKTGKKFRLATSTTIPTFDELGFESVPPTQAIQRVLNLIGMSRNAFDGLAQRYKMQAFTVAGISDVRLIEQIKNALADVMQAGGTEKDFQAAVNALTDAAGVARLAKTQIDTVFQTAVQTAYQNGRFEQMTDPAVVAALPYWMYRTAGDDRVRPAHAALDGFCAKYNDVVWNRLYPPCGYNCRCTVTAEGPGDVGADADTPGLSRIPLAAASVPDPGFGGIQ
ncbi:MAG TPA: phage minor head protein [Candidatus Angelobacter sp.]|nr:phage minor head protein [Candidatus Angelobacter sp.]